METIRTSNAPEPKGAYSQGCVHNGVVYVAGQLGLDPATGETPSSESEPQLRQALKNVKAVVEAGGSDLAHLLRVNVYLTDESQFPLLNKIYAEYIPEPYPPRTARVVELGPYAVEVDATAAVIDKE